MRFEDYDGKTGFLSMGKRGKQGREGRRNRVERGKEKDQVFYF